MMMWLYFLSKERNFYIMEVGRVEPMQTCWSGMYIEQLLLFLGYASLVRLHPLVISSRVMIWLYLVILGGVAMIVATPSLVVNFSRLCMVDITMPICRCVACPIMMLCSEGAKMTMNSRVTIFLLNPFMVFQREW